MFFFLLFILNDYTCKLMDIKACDRIRLGLGIKKKQWNLTIIGLCCIIKKSYTYEIWKLNQIIKLNYEYE